MKKFFAAIIAFSAVCCLASCGEKKPEKKPDRVSTAPIDEKILGTWMNENIGYRFQEDRFVSLIMDQSDYVHFEGDSIIVQDQTLGADMIDDNGTDVRVFYPYVGDDGSSSEMDILLMTRDEPSNKGFDGTYHITGGVVGDYIATILGATTNEFDMIAEVSGAEFTVIFNNFSQFETKDGNVDMFGDSILVPGSDDDSVRYKYTISGDTLTMDFVSGKDTEPEVYTRVK